MTMSSPTSITTLSIKLPITGATAPSSFPSPRQHQRHSPSLLHVTGGPKYTNIKDRVHQRSRCDALFKPRTQDVLQHNGLPIVKEYGTFEDIVIPTTSFYENETLKEQYVKEIKLKLESMGDGEISISAYDTAWVALVVANQRNGEIGTTAQFPSCLQWISENQLADGSWGDALIFSPHDRLLNTLACVVALKTWNIHHDQCQRGIEFFGENLWKLEDESNEEHMTVGFEVAFPSLLEIARNLGIEVPLHSPVLQKIYATRNLKLERIPKDVMHSVPTSLLYSLEGMPGLDWEKLLNLQCQNGSFLFSPSSTAYALMQTNNDANCLTYLNKLVQRFQGGVPTVYPVDLFEHSWAVDRLQRLGICRYFQAEIKECVNYVYRHWTKDGTCWARDSNVHDIDDTSMMFRILRLHGYHVSAEVFKQFEKGGEFFCFAGQSSQPVTGMHHLCKASQVMFPGEKILEDAKRFSSQFLLQKQAANQLLDKWIIAKDLPGEVRFTLELPWAASLPRVEARHYLEQYGGEDDVWIGKAFYRMPNVSNNSYLQLAKLDFNECQALHQMEWDSFQSWCQQSNLKEFGLSKRALLYNYFLAAANIFEPERSKERLAWAKTATLLDTIQAFFDNLLDNDTDCRQSRRAFVHAFRNGNVDDHARHLVINGRMSGDKKMQQLLWMVLGTLKDISQSLSHAWEKWLVKWEEEGDRRQGEAELLLVETILMCSSAAENSVSGPELLLPHGQYQRLANLTNSLCIHLSSNERKATQDTHLVTISPEIETEMQQLAQLALLQTPCDEYECSSRSMDSEVKQAFLAVARSFYYTAICDPETINNHIARVLFQKVH